MLEVYFTHLFLNDCNYMFVKGNVLIIIVISDQIISQMQL
jgi:hypothetical protein